MNTYLFGVVVGNYNSPLALAVVPRSVLQLVTLSNDMLGVAELCCSLFVLFNAGSRTKKRDENEVPFLLTLWKGIALRETLTDVH